ncbi:hypothetical protein H8A95_15755 [Bradyrhizobium sp. Pear76]|uniref:hypothetical protein n=1 Tax=Bradyrhizobium oropedii TaxID=1571201 RepID=UPI001E4C5B15|nr:hypothetical protein [Bradyrhizobium oropedii]MCC8963725.1 hypothetical protein [Bradyrhizobium oropedii]
MRTTPQNVRGNAPLSGRGYTPAVETRPGQLPVRFERNFGMFNTCHNVQAYRGFEHVGGASYCPVAKDWLIAANGRDLGSYRHDRAVSLEANLTAIENIIGAALADEQARAA